MIEPMRDATLKDIARQADVSPSTVSRVVRGNYPVSDEVRRRVGAAIKELGYRPNAIARNLRRQKSNLIAYVIPDVANQFFMDAAKGLERGLGESGHHMVVASSQGSIARERELVDILMEQRIAGLVIASTDTAGDKLRSCIDSGIPVVLIDRAIEGLPAHMVLWDNFTVARDLTRLLIDHGHRRIGIVNGSLKHVNGATRLDGFRRAMADAGLKTPRELISPSQLAPADAIPFVMKAMRLPEPPTALFCANKHVLEGTRQALRELNLRIHDDVSVVAFGSTVCNKCLYPKITAAEQDGVEMGRRAEALLRDLLNNRTSSLTRVVLNAAIAVRDSVKRIV